MALLGCIIVFILINLFAWMVHRSNRFYEFAIKIQDDDPVKAWLMYCGMVFILVIICTTILYFSCIK